MGHRLVSNTCDSLSPEPLITLHIGCRTDPGEEVGAGPRVAAAVCRSSEPAPLRGHRVLFPALDEKPSSLQLCSFTLGLTTRTASLPRQSAFSREFPGHSQDGQVPLCSPHYLPVVMNNVFKYPPVVPGEGPQRPPGQLLQMELFGVCVVQRSRGQARGNAHLASCHESSFSAVIQAVGRGRRLPHRLLPPCHGSRRARWRDPLSWAVSGELLLASLFSIRLFSVVLDCCFPSRVRFSALLCVLFLLFP